MTDDTSDEPRADDADERTSDDADDRTTDDADDRTTDDGGEDEIAATATHEYVWRCRGCKAQYDERPEECDRCGGTSFQRYREL